MISEAVPMSWQVNGLTLRGLSWGSTGASPLLALHGWLDNAASFSVLAPLLPDHHVVAVDLTGHGLTDHRSADSSYQIWDDLPELDGVLEQLGWGQFDLMGHSRGAVISTLLAAALGDRVEHLIMLDAATPQPLPEAQFVRQLANSLKDKRSMLGAPNRLYTDKEGAIAARCKTGMTVDAASLLVDRSMKKVDDGVTWTTDRRLHGASAVKLTEGQVISVLDNLKMPALLALASRGHGGEPLLSKAARTHLEHLEVYTSPGGHHFHMEAEASALATRIRQFLST